MKLIIGIFGDNIKPFWDGFLINHQFYETYTYGIGKVIKYENTNPIIWNTYIFLSKYISEINTWNIMIVLFITLSLIFTYKLFNLYFSKINSTLLATIYTFSPYLYYRAREHLDLSAIFLYPIYFYYLIKTTENKRKYIYLGLISTIIFLTSVYLCYFILIITSLYILLQTNFIKNTKLAITKVSIYYATFIIFLLTFSYQYIYVTYLNPEKTGSIQGLSRPLEDFFYFSSRPWYYFLPSPENPWFGSITTKAISIIQSSNYYLNDNYFPSEHTASYLGYINFIFAIIGFIYIYKQYKNKKIENALKAKYRSVFILGIVSLILMVLTLPPYISINMHKIYMPSYLLYKFFPMFRVLARMGIIVLLIELIYTGFGYKAFLEFIKNNTNRIKSISFKKIIQSKWQYVSTVILIPFFILSLMEFYIPIKVTDITVSPKIYTYIKNNTDKDSIIAVYPGGRANDTLFWMREYQRTLINPKGYSNLDGSFNSEKFTKLLNTCDGLIDAKKLGVTHIVYFYNEDKDESESKIFFNTNTTFITESPEYGLDIKGNRFIKILNKSDGQSFSAKLYSLNDSVCEE